MSDVIVNITNALVKAAGSQAAARDAINTAENDIKMANDTLSKVRNDNTELNRDVTRDDLQRRFSAHHSVATLLRYCFDLFKHCSNIVVLKIVVENRLG